MIPEAAVEAALVAYDPSWAPIPGDYGPQEHFRQKMRLALEAAAPHLQELQWGVRDNVSLHIAGHPSEESARSIAEEHPEWYEVVSRPMPGLWTTK